MTLARTCDVQDIILITTEDSVHLALTMFGCFAFHQLSSKIGQN